MAKNLSTWLCLLGLWLGLVASVRGQTQVPAALPDAPAPLPKILERPPAYVLPPVDQPIAGEPVLDPLLNPPEAPPSGFISNLEFLFVAAHINSQLVGPVTLSPTQTDVVTLKMGNPGFAVSPRFEVGYRLPEQRGEFLLSYRFETAENTSVPTDALGGLSQKDRLNFNLVDLDWGNQNFFALGPGWNLRFNVGARLVTVYYDTRRDFGGPLFNPAGLVNQRATNDFIGGGPLFGMDISRDVAASGLALFGRFRASGDFGEIRQSFSETTTTAGALLAGGNSASYQVFVPTITVQGGLQYTPPRWHQCHFMLGYVWEEFWAVGRLNNTAGTITSQGNLLNRGLVFRVEFNF